MFDLNLVSKLIVLSGVVSLASSLIIEVIKKIASEEKIKNYFKSLEIFSLILTFSISLCIYVAYVSFIIVPPLSLINTIKIVIIGFVFSIACGCGSQIGYDKVIKVVKDIINMLS